MRAERARALIVVLLVVDLRSSRIRSVLSLDLPSEASNTDVARSEGLAAPRQRRAVVVFLPGAQRQVRRADIVLPLGAKRLLCVAQSAKRFPSAKRESSAIVTNCNSGRIGELKPRLVALLIPSALCGWIYRSSDHEQKQSETSGSGSD